MASHAMRVPLPAENLDDWKAFAMEASGPRRRELEDMNRRHGLTRHAAWLQPEPDGTYGVIVLLEGPRADGFHAAVATSSHAFDRWFTEQVQRIHRIDLSAVVPGSTLHLDARTESAERGAQEVARA